MVNIFNLREDDKISYIMETNFGDSSSSDFGKLSKINSAALVNSMLSNLWGDYFRHLRIFSYFQANDDLDCIWTILGGEKGIKGKDEEQTYNDIQKKISELGISPINKEKEKQPIKRLAKMAMFKKILMEKGLFLRRLQNKQGKGTAYIDEDEGDFD